MDSAGEVVLFALGVLVILLFATCTVGACIGRDTNWQESFEKDKEVAFLGTDDMWHPGVRLEHKYNLNGWIELARGISHVRADSGEIFRLSNHEIINIDNFFRPKDLKHIFKQTRTATNLEDGTAPYVGNYMRAYTPVWSFTINNVIIALSTAVGFEVRISNDVDQVVGFFIIFGVTFLSGFIIMFIFFVCFGFGEAMLAPRRPKVLSNALVHKIFKGNVKMSSGEAMVMTETNQIYGPRLKFNYVSKIYIEPPKYVQHIRQRHREHPI